MVKMTLLEEMKQCLPIPVRPTKQLCRLLRKKGTYIEMDIYINIIGVFDSGDMGGIICALDSNQKDQLVVSLTQLLIKPDHPLSNKIAAYQIKRIKSL
jgi:hypothetical protein